MCMYACVCAREETPCSICVCCWQRIEYRSTDHPDSVSAACQLFIMASRIDSSFIFFSLDVVGEVPRTEGSMKIKEDALLAHLRWSSRMTTMMRVVMAVVSEI